MLEKLALSDDDYEYLTKGIAAGVGIGILVGPFIGNIILKLKKIGITVISILHDMDFVDAYFDRVVVLKKGRIIASGTRETVFSQTDILEEDFIEQPYLSKLCNLL